MFITRARSLVRFSKQRRFFASLATTIDEKAAVFPTKDVVQFKGMAYKWNMQQVRTHGGALAHGLQCLGVKSNDSILSLLAPSPEQINLAVAASFIGANVMTFGDVAKIEAVEKVLGEAKPKVIFADEKDIEHLANLVPALKPTATSTGILSEEKFPSLKYVIQTGPHAKRNTLRYLDSLVYFNSFMDDSFDVDSSVKVLSILDTAGNVSKSYSTKELMKEAGKKSKALGIEGDIVVETKVDNVEDGILLTLGALQSLGKVVLKF